MSSSERRINPAISMSWRSRPAAGTSSSPQTSCAAARRRIDITSGVLYFLEEDSEDKDEIKIFRLTRRFQDLLLLHRGGTARAVPPLSFSREVKNDSAWHR